MYSRLGPFLAVLCAGLSAPPSSALAESKPSTAAATTATTTVVEGKLIIAITADNKSALPVTTTLWCNARAALSSGFANSYSYEYRYYFAKAEVTASQVSCAIELPYHLTVSDPATAVVSVSSAISSTPLANVAFLPFLPIASSAPKTELYVSLPSLSFPLPPAGATTLKSIHDFI